MQFRENSIGNQELQTRVLYKMLIKTAGLTGDKSKNISFLSVGFQLINLEKA